MSFINQKNIKKTIGQLGTLLFGSGFSFLVNVVGLYIYSKLYSAEQFGVFALFVSVISIVSIVTSLGLEYVIVLQKTVKEALYIRNVCENIVIYFSLILVFISVLLVAGSIQFFDESELIWILVVMSIFSISMINIFISWNNKLKNYKIISTYKLVQSISVSFISVFLGYKNVSLGLVFAYSIGVFVSFLYLWRSIDRKHLFKRIELPELKLVLSKNRDTINYSYNIGLLLTAVKALPNFVLGHFFGLGIVGVYDMSIKILNIPKKLLSSNIGELFYQKGSVLYNRNNMKFVLLARDTSKYLFLFSILSYFLFALFGTELFSFFLGDKWALAGELSEVLSFWYMLLFISSPMAYVFYIRRTLNKYFKFTVFVLLIKASFLFIIVNYNTAINSVYLYTYVCIGLELLLLIYIYIKGFLDLKDE